MSAEESRAYDPLTVEELGRNAARALMGYPAVAMPPLMAQETGVYTVHYHGIFEAYAGLGEVPIYVGQARNLAARLSQHTQSIAQAENLDLADFTCRWLILAPVWVGLTEDILIRQYRPLWNVIRGFGNHAPGSGRIGQQCSPWDTLHPGRFWATDLQPLPGGRDAVLTAIRSHRQGG